ncbi:hypothetical protein [Ralstonia pseudosolanacearum]|uniref:hypothetical protein n=1 Tax=Ralstonia pseudosolanacearum TaxID=1310165 RepID=UPI003CE9B861
MEADQTCLPVAQSGANPDKGVTVRVEEGSTLPDLLQLFNVTLDWEPGDEEQGDYATSVWAVDSDDAIRRVAEEMANSGEVCFDSDELRSEYIERVVNGAGQFAAELVKDSLDYDLGNLLKDRPDALTAIKAILDGAQVVETNPSTIDLSSDKGMTGAQEVLHLPSSEGHGEYDLYALAPAGMSKVDARGRINEEIRRAGREAAESIKGGCSVSSPLEASIKQALETEGFSFFKPEMTTCWDEPFRE